MSIYFMGGYDIQYTYSNRHNVYDWWDERTNTDVLVNLYYYVIHIEYW